MADAENGDEQPNPRTKLMQEVARQMDAIEADFADQYEIGEVITIVQVLQPAGPAIRVRSTGPYLEALGMLRVAERILHQMNEQD